METSNDLSKEITSIAKKSGALLIGTTKLYKVQSIIIIGTPFNENWHLSYYFSGFKRLLEEHTITRDLLDSISKIVIKEGFTAKQKTPLSIFGDFRPLAIAAGLGHYGRNGLVINKDYSSGLVFSAITTNAPVEIKDQPEKLDCSNCKFCVELCPANALSEGRLDYKKCLPYAIRGCSQCMKACGYAINEQV